jgi:hypothetical protein
MRGGDGGGGGGWRGDLRLGSGREDQLGEEEEERTIRYTAQLLPAAI